MINITVSKEKKHKISPYLYMQFMEPLGTADSSVDAGWDYQNDCWFDIYSKGKGAFFFGRRCCICALP